MPAVGDVLADRYRIDAVLGAGGMAVVYRATDLRLDRPVAVKILLPNLARDGRLAARFDREARLLAAVAHPSIAEVFDVEPGDAGAGREPFFVMELCDGGSLADRVDRRGPLPPGELVPLILSVAAGLGELHRRGLVHRDVKPGNILFSAGRPKLADFGLVKSSAGAEPAGFTEPGTVVGTPAYMAPELIAGQPATTASDVYGLAATTYFGLTGRAPRPGETITHLAATASEPISPASALAPGLGPAFDRPLDLAMSADGGARPSLNALTMQLATAMSEGEGQPTITVDPLADTTAMPITTPATRLARAATVSRPEAEPTARRLPPPRPGGRRDGRGVVAITGLLLLAVLALAAILGFLGQFAGGAPRDSEPTPGPSSTPTPGPSPSPSPVVTPVDPLDAALSALDDVAAAIELARGGPDGLSGNQVQDLFKLADEVGKHLREGKFDKAVEATEKLDEQAHKLAEDLDGERAGILFESIANLRRVIPD